MEDFFETRPRLQLCQAPGIDEEKEWTSNKPKMAYSRDLAVMDYHGLSWNKL